MSHRTEADGGRATLLGKQERTQAGGVHPSTSDGMRAANQKR